MWRTSFHRAISQSTVRLSLFQNPSACFCSRLRMGFLSLRWISSYLVWLLNLFVFKKSNEIVSTTQMKRIKTTIKNIYGNWQNYNLDLAMIKHISQHEIFYFMLTLYITILIFFYLSLMTQTGEGFRKSGCCHWMLGSNILTLWQPLLPNCLWLTNWLCLCEYYTRWAVWQDGVYLTT